MIGFGLKYFSILLTFSSFLIQPTSADIIQKIICDFKTENWNAATGSIYICDITSEYIQVERNVPIKKITNGKPKQELKGFHAIGKSAYFIPDFTPLSKGIIAITLHRCKVLKLNKDDLKPYPKLVYLMLLKNKLRVIEKDVFEYTPDLKYIDIGFNMIKEIVPGAFDNLKNLNELHLLTNECIQKEASDRTAVVKFIEELKEKCIVKYRATVIGRKREEVHRRKQREKTNLWVTFGITFGTCVFTMSTVVVIYFCKKCSLKDFFEILFLTFCITLSTSLDLTCFYKLANYGNHFTDKIYQCTVTDNLNITTHDIVIENLIGKHTQEKEAKDVTGIHIKDKILEYFPSGLDKLIPNLLGLSIQNSKLKETNQNDLKQFPKMQHLFIIQNQLTVLEKDLLKFNPDLIYINLKENKIKTIDSNIFDGLRSLIDLNLLKNECIDIEESKIVDLSKIIFAVKENCGPKIPINITCKTSIIGLSHRHIPKGIHACGVNEDLNINAKNYEFAALTYNNNISIAKYGPLNGIHIKNKIINYFPIGLSKLIPNIIGIGIDDTKLMEITKNDLKHFPKLLHLFLRKNLLKVLEKDLFKFNPDLKFINIDENLLTKIDPNIFDHLIDLKHLHLKKNMCIDSATNLFIEVEDLIELVVVKCNENVEKATTTFAPKSNSKVNILTEPSEEQEEDEKGHEKITEEKKIETQDIGLPTKLGFIFGIIWISVAVGCGVYCFRKKCS
ncbi:hypothetical protein PVAND_015313 [Polypedilum vanderplanki]|uniref:Uncharacterized protein n=2 Tax=Polypedilum vanderplanki TaxID=319348 RepID=A0A9J6BC99_POLVA|nr:hypothetical protein PVAND_015313 [Polypedilum vanderplanki]